VRVGWSTTAFTSIAANFVGEMTYITSVPELVVTRPFAAIAKPSVAAMWRSGTPKRVVSLDSRSLLPNKAATPPIALQQRGGTLLKKKDPSSDESTNGPTACRSKKPVRESG